MGKNPLFSKTLWLNMIGGAAVLLQGELGFLLPPEYQALGLIAANLVLRFMTGQPIDWSKIKVRGIGAPMLLVLLLITASSLPTLSGCGALRIFEEQPVLTELTVRVAVGRVLEENPTWVEPTKEITADAIRLVTESDQVALAGLETYVLQRIPWQQLTVEEEELLRVLVHVIRVEIESELERQGVSAPEEVRVRVAQVLGWIYQSAEIRAARTGLGV